MAMVVSMLAFYSSDLCLNPADAYSFYVRLLFEKNKKDAVVGPFLVSICFEMTKIKEIVLFP